MAATIPSDSHIVGDPGHTSDHDNVADVLGLFAQALAISTGNAPGTVPASNAANVAAVQALVSAWSGFNSSSYQFYPEAYGAYGDGKIVTDGAMSSSTNPTYLTCATSAPFNAATDIGKWVNVGQAGGGTYTSLCAQITAVNSSSVAVLSASCTFTCSSSIVVFGHDDTAAINLAVAAAYNAWNANKKLLPSILFSQKIYCLGGTGSPVNSTSPTGAGLGNALIPLPIVPNTGEKLTLAFQGVPDSTGLLYWLQTIPQTSGACIACLRTDGTNDGTYGPSSVIGGPLAGYGGTSTWNVFSNMLAVFDGIEILVPYNGTYGGVDLCGVAEANVTNLAVQSMAVVPSSGPYPSQGTPGNITHLWPIGLRMPASDNNDDSTITAYACQGLYCGLMPSEHCVALSVRCINCNSGISPYSINWLQGTSLDMPHAARIEYASVENSVYALNYVNAEGAVNLDIGVIDTETITTWINDPSSQAHGTIGAHLYSVSGYSSSLGTAPYVKIILLDQVPGPVTSGAPAAPATTVAQYNYFYRDAYVYVTSTSAISSASADATVITGLTTAGAGTIMIPVPAGHSYKVTSSGTITTQWVLL